MGWWTIEIRGGDDIPWLRRQNTMGLWTTQIRFGDDIP